MLAGPATLQLLACSQDKEFCAYKGGIEIHEPIWKELWSERAEGGLVRRWTFQGLVKHLLHTDLVADRHHLHCCDGPYW